MATTILIQQLEKDKFTLQTHCDTLTDENLSLQTRIRRQQTQNDLFQKKLKIAKNRIMTLQNEQKTFGKAFISFINYQCDTLNSLNSFNNQFLSSFSKSYQYLLIDKKFDFDMEISLLDSRNEIKSMIAHAKSLIRDDKVLNLSKLEQQIEKKFDLKSSKNHFSEQISNLQEVFEGVRMTFNDSKTSQLDNLTTLIKQQNLKNSSLQQLLTTQNFENCSQIGQMNTENSKNIQNLVTQVHKQKKILDKTSTLVQQGTVCQAQILSNVQNLDRKIDESDVLQQSINPHSGSNSPRKSQFCPNNHNLNPNSVQLNNRMLVSRKTPGLFDSQMEGSSSNKIGSDQRTNGVFQESQVVKCFKIPSPGQDKYSPMALSQLENSSELLNSQNLFENDSKLLAQLSNQNSEMNEQIEDLMLQKSDFELKIRVANKQIKQQSVQMGILKNELSSLKKNYEFENNQIQDIETVFAETMSKIECYELANMSGTCYKELLITKQIEINEKMDIFKDLDCEIGSDSDISGSFCICG